MPDRITRRLKQNIESVDTLADYSKRLFQRLGLVGKSFENIERSNQVAQQKIAEANEAIAHELSTRTETITAVLKELYEIFQESGEELSQVQTQLNEAQKEIERGAQIAGAAKYDVANVQMLAKTAKLFTQVDEDTVITALNEFDLAVLQSALESVSTKRWLQLEGVFEAARHGRRE